MLPCVNYTQQSYNAAWWSNYSRCYLICWSEWQAGWENRSRAAVMFRQFLTLLDHQSTSVQILDSTHSSSKSLTHWTKQSHKGTTVGGIPPRAEWVRTRCSFYYKLITIRWRSCWVQEVAGISHCRRGNVKHVTCRNAEVKNVILQRKPTANIKINHYVQ